MDSICSFLTAFIVPSSLSIIRPIVVFPFHIITWLPYFSEKTFSFGSVHGLHSLSTAIVTFSGWVLTLSGYFYLMGLIWGMGKRNAKIKEYEKLQFFFFPAQVFSLKKQNSARERHGEVAKTQTVHSLLLTVFTVTHPDLLNLRLHLALPLGNSYCKRKDSGKKKKKRLRVLRLRERWQICLWRNRVSAHSLIS